MPTHGERRRDQKFFVGSNLLVTVENGVAYGYRETWVFDVDEIWCETCQQWSSLPAGRFILTHTHEPQKQNRATLSSHPASPETNLRAGY